MAYSITITNTNNLKYRFFEAEVPSLTYQRQTRKLKQELPDDDGTNAIVINLGKSQLINFPFKLFETSDDASVGTHTSTVKTIKEKVDYWLETFLTNGIEDLYTIEINFHAGSETVTITRTGIEDSFSINPIGQNPNDLIGNFSIDVGGGSQ